MLSTLKDKNFNGLCQSKIFLKFGLLSFFQSFRDLDLFPLPDGWEKGLNYLIQPQCNGKGWDGEIQGASPGPLD
jgi:hypothetical protein